MRGQEPDEDARRAEGAEATDPAEAPLAGDPSRSSPLPGRAPAFAQTVLGWLAPESTGASVFVDFTGNAAGPLRARSTVCLDEATIARAIAVRQPVALVFENGDARLPIVLGLLQEAPSPLHGLLTTEPASPAPSANPPDALPRTEANVDGKRVVITADQEITLKCGDASLTLRRDGKILLRGAYVETYARGLNRIKGAQVKIN
jgi:hypothetical protein